MTLAEYQIYCQKLEEEEKQIKLEYAKNNPIQKSIVDEIYDRESKLKYNYMAYSYDFHLLNAIEPWSFISKDDYKNDLYVTFLEHDKEIYRDRYKDHFGVDNEWYNKDARFPYKVRNACNHRLPKDHKGIIRGYRE